MKNQYGINSTEDFIKVAKEIHGNIYDYSKSIYVNMHTKLIIGCPKHGNFEQPPSQHITRKTGCPNCRWEKTKNTCIKKYGVRNVFQSNEIMTEDVKEKSKKSRKETFIKRYGVKSPSQLDEVKEKKKQTSIKKYGVDSWTKTKEGRKYLKEKNSSPEILAKMKKTTKERFGVDSVLQLPEVRAKQKIATNTEQYKEKRKRKADEIWEKAWETRKKNGTTSSSSFETEFYTFLLSIFSEKDIIRNYKEERYPYHCDFYIVPIDYFIELNIHWSHGKHFFDRNNPEDISIIKKWEEKATKHKSYKIAIDVWRNKDLKKVECAIKNNLTYIVLWDQTDIDIFKEGFENWWKEQK